MIVSKDFESNVPKFSARPPSAKLMNVSIMSQGIGSEVDIIRDLDGRSLRTSAKYKTHPERQG